MGNYMETCIQKQQTDEEKPQKLQESWRKPEGSYGTESGRMRVKLVLTKDELEWLLLQLKNKEGQRLEDVLGEIEKGRMAGKNVVAGWKPSLESIMENPEVHHEMDRSS
ncbi:uncharacterized protein LOC112529585 [Cynara cardunculus var. scolymus]|uniref:Uncharacterized protein n=1 Tax=Cynara cardunculus var. scolymus TaxID=59895 RepID=A0A103XJF4_CYNCS|nr:uncharacterized protein LOC112529585 [Cynara cardunculus var. scolymus]KVH91798.1 hypothetical protein Ccrd_006168 [Cynara cardunculus var. scolymus]